MEKVIVTRPMVGIAGMQVCAAKHATDEEILEVCNRENPAGTMNGWGDVVRGRRDPSCVIPDHHEPVQCADFPDRIHLLVLC